VLTIPGKLHDKREVHFLTRSEINAILAAPDRSSWIGRRDHMLLHLAAQTGLRLSEIIQLERNAVVLGTGAYVRCLGKGRKERSTPLTTQTATRSRRGSRIRGSAARQSCSPTSMAAA
jgi:integrase/recombinase XerD